MPILLLMESGKQTEPDDLRRMADENRKAIDRVKEDLRRLKEQIGIKEKEKTQSDESE